MATQRPILTPDTATGRVYIVTSYTRRGDELIAHDQTDVSEVFAAIVQWLADTGRLTLRGGRG